MSLEPCALSLLFFVIQPTPLSKDGGAGVTLMIEREVKLRFASPEEARAAIVATGATALRSRRLQEDALLDTEDESLRERRCVLRIRTESGKSLLTFKGPVLPGSMKVRDEYETVIGDGEVVQRVLEEVGLHVWFRYEKYREEYAAQDVTIALDETPVGTFVEIEGGEEGILTIAQALGRTPSDFLLDSYRALFMKHREEFGLTGTNMVFSEE
jgi:adenylate cyclase, class 2